MSNFTRRHAVKTMAFGAAASTFGGPYLARAATSGEDAFSLMRSDLRFSYWIQTLKFAGLEQYASGENKFTAFVPTNAAMSKYPDVLAELTRVNDSIVYRDTTNQAEFIRAHIVLGLHPLSGFAGKVSTLLSIAETPITIDGSKAGSYKVTWVSVNWRSATAQITDTPMVASDALLYPFNDVVLS